MRIIMMYNDVNITVRKDFHNNQYTVGNNITKNNNVCNSDNSKNVENRHQSQKSAIKKYRSYKDGKSQTNLKIESILHE